MIKKRNVGFAETVVQMCTCLTCISLVWAIMFPLYADKGFLADILFTLIYGLGGIGIYFPLGLQIRKAYDWSYTH